MLYSQKTEHYGVYDVIVAGGGPAGFAAGISAARGGMKTLLIESSGAIGGVSTSGALPFILGATSGSIPFPQMIEKGLKYSELPHPRRAVGGIFEDFAAAVKEKSGGIGPGKLAQTDLYPGLDRLGCHDEFTFDLETGKLVFDEMAQKSGLDILYYTQVLQPDMAGGRVRGIWFSNKSGILYAECRAIIDCTGDADVAYRAGYPTYKGDRETGEMTSVGLVAHIENIDPGPIEEYLNRGGDPWFRTACEAANAEHPDYEGPTHLIVFPMLQPGVFMINGGTSFSDIDGTNGDDLTKITVMGRKRARFITEEIFKKHIPGGANCRLRLTAAQPGVRETRRIIGEYMLTEDDLLDGVVFGDTVALAGRHFDLSRGKKITQPFAESGKRVKLGVTPIPYRALIPKGSDDIIVAGRCISADGQALGPARIMSTCMAVGEAAGTAAAMKVKKGLSFRAVDTDELRDELRLNGAEVDV